MLIDGSVMVELEPTEDIDALTPSELPTMVSSVASHELASGPQADIDAMPLEPSRPWASLVGGLTGYLSAKLVGWRSWDYGHPFVKLTCLAAVVVGIGAMGAEYGEAPVLSADESDIPPAASEVAPLPPLSPLSPVLAGASQGTKNAAADVDPLDVEDDEDDASHRHGSKDKDDARRRSTNHAPDAKAGENTGFRDGKPIKVTLTIVDGKPVEERTAAAFQKMRVAAQRAGVSIVVVSGFRTMDRQKELYADYKAGRGHLAALPGHSNHQSGLALDLAVGAPKVRAWLEAHAADYGFRRTVPSEAWHWEHQ